MASFDTYLDNPPYVRTTSAPVYAGDTAPYRCDNGSCLYSNSYQLYVGSNSARMVFDMGDGDLTACEVVWAVRTAQRIRFSDFPVSNEYGVVGASYWNQYYAGSKIYTHADHRAIHDALWNTDFGTPGPQWARTSRNDPDRVRTDVVDNDTNCVAICVSPLPVDPVYNSTAQRTGYVQYNYGWLTDTYWENTPYDDGSVFSQSQTFWGRY